MKLYEITDDYAALMAAIEDADGYITDEQLDLLDSVTDDLNEKVENTCKVVRNMDAEAVALSVEAQRLSARSKTLKNKVKGLKGYVRSCLEGAGVKEAGGLLKARLVKARESVEITDQSALPPAFLLPQDPKPDKVGIMEAWKRDPENFNVPGAAVREGEPGIRIV